ncbi:transposase [Paenibacillus aceris]|uniref:Transposase zinc-ribbon domain-containing protein n=1 Tax=Paenibacillus aceris TaxID=869555 RepID=A0ABS4HUT6_9BACL|nr:transposase [Paenibacillus aceris]MBP1962126.1 hypothetical protein [Paenibacillus aceris]NHW34025.1 transposase [Paenibacillus aceris]
MGQQYMDMSTNFFCSEEECEQFLTNMRWSNGFCCPRCDNNEAFNIRSRRLLECKECRMQVSLTAGTIMHKSKLPLLLWFQAIQLLIKEGINCTASKLARVLQINYRSAQLLLTKIQFAFEYTQNRVKLLSKENGPVSNSDSQTADDLQLSETSLKVAQTQNNSSTWDLNMYLESKINKLQNKLTFRNKRLNIPQLFAHMKNQSNRGHDCLSLLNKYVKMAISNQFYPTFLKCFQYS